MAIPSVGDGFYHPDLYPGDDGQYHGEGERTPSPRPAPGQRSDTGPEVQKPIEAGVRNPSGPGNDPQFRSTVPDGPLSKEESDKVALKVMDGLIGQFGLTSEQAAGVVGNLCWESSDPTVLDSSGMNPHINEVAYAPKDSIYSPPLDNEGGYAWGQWSDSRKQDYLNFAAANNLTPGSEAASYSFLTHELRDGEPWEQVQGETDTIEALRATDSAAEAATAFRRVYERSENPIDQNRIRHANRLLDLYLRTQ